MSNEFLILETSGASTDASTFSGSWFGAIQTGYRSFQGFETAAEDINIGLLRWPGGTLSETRPEVYGLDIPGLFDATDLWVHNPDRQRPDLAEALAYAIQQGFSFSMVIPTARYADDLQLGEAHLRAFLVDLFSGTYGQLPSDFTLELGNEYYALDAFAESPATYGTVASHFAEIIDEVAQQLLSPEERSNIDIAVQMGRSAEDNSEILNAFSASLATISSVVFHSLPISLNNLNSANDEREGLTRYDSAANHFEIWRDAIEAAGGTSDPDLFLSAWAVGGSGSGGDATWHEYGARSVAMVLDTFAGYSSIGVDAAAVWGMNSSHDNRVSTAEGEQSELTHIGELLRLMSESLPGMTLQGAFVPHSRIDAVMSWSFGNGTDYTSFIAVNEIDAAQQEVTILFDGLMNFQIGSALMMGSELSPEYTGSPSDPEASFFELPVLSDLQFRMTQDGIRFAFNNNFEAATVSVSENPGLSGSSGMDWIAGTATDDVIEGLAGADFLNGGTGNDTLIGGDGADQIEGGLGDDLIFGGGEIDADAYAAYLQYVTQSNGQMPAALPLDQGTEPNDFDFSAEEFVFDF